MRPEQIFINQVPYLFMHHRDPAIKFGFLPLNLIFQHSDELASEKRHDPYESDKDKESWEKFKESLLEGQFFPLFVSPFDYTFPEYLVGKRKTIVESDAFGNNIPRTLKLIIREGTHRLKAFHELANEGKLPQDFLVATVICYDGYPLFPDENLGIDRQLIETSSFYGRFWETYNEFFQMYFKEAVKVAKASKDDPNIKPCKQLNVPVTENPDVEDIPILDVKKFTQDMINHIPD